MRCDKIPCRCTDVCVIKLAIYIKQCQIIVGDATSYIKHVQRKPLTDKAYERSETFGRSLHMHGPSMMPYECLPPFKLRPINTTLLYSHFIRLLNLP